MTSVPTSLPRLPGSVLRARLCRAREELHELEGRVPADLAPALGGVLEAIESSLILSFGWQYPEDLTANDVAFLASAGCPA